MHIMMYISIPFLMLVPVALAEQQHSGMQEQDHTALQHCTPQQRNYNATTFLCVTFCRMHTSTCKFAERQKHPTLLAPIFCLTMQTKI